jgi:hypothetical protein
MNNQGSDFDVDKMSSMYEVMVKDNAILKSKLESGEIQGKIVIDFQDAYMDRKDYLLISELLKRLELYNSIEIVNHNVTGIL